MLRDGVKRRPCASASMRSTTRRAEADDPAGRSGRPCLVREYPDPRIGRELNPRGVRVTSSFFEGFPLHHLPFRRFRSMGVPGGPTPSSTARDRGGADRSTVIPLYTGHARIRRGYTPVEGCAPGRWPGQQGDGQRRRVPRLPDPVDDADTRGWLGGSGSGISAGRTEVSDDGADRAGIVDGGHQPQAVPAAGTGQHVQGQRRGA